MSTVRSFTASSSRNFRRMIKMIMTSFAQDAGKNENLLRLSQRRSYSVVRQLHHDSMEEPTVLKLTRLLRTSVR